MYGSRRVPVLQLVCAVAAGVALVTLARVPTAAQQPSGRRLVTIAGLSAGDVREAISRVDSMRRSGELRLRTRRDDLLVSGRTHERFDQYHRGVRVFGADVAEQLNRGQVVSVFGNVYDDIGIETTPTIEVDRALEIVAERAGVELGPGQIPELVVLPRDGRYTLSWRVRAMTLNDLREYFVDARTGVIALEYSDLQTQSAVGRGIGVLGDTKKISVRPSDGQFVASDELRPPNIDTYDMKGDHIRTRNYVNGLVQLSPADLARDPDNTWNDGMAVDAHVYFGWTYDYYFKRHNRRGIDNNDRPIRNLVHPARRQDWQQNFGPFSLFYTNAAYYGSGIVIFGVGLPPNVTLGGQIWDFTSGSLDLVAHELTHGVTDYSSDLIYQNESGALNEAFSDIVGTSVEFYYEPPGSGSQRADYLLAEDVVRPGGIRSMADPGAYSDPDHYSRRLIVPLDNDNGGVHTNSGIANHAFYLAIEGGTNRTSGLGVQGVGAANREQVERVFFRAFTQMLPANATHSVARAATIQAARDIFGANSNAERAVTQAWTAVGVN
jgi:bacillolysin